MIAFVRGQVAAVTLSSAVIEVGGVGLQLMCTPRTLADLRHGQEATLPTSMVVREDSLTLFGFLDDDEKSIFVAVGLRASIGAAATMNPATSRPARAFSSASASSNGTRPQFANVTSDGDSCKAG